MRKLVPELVQLLIDNQMAGINISRLFIKPYEISIMVNCESFGANHIPSSFQSDYRTEVGLRNSLLPSNGSAYNLTPLTDDYVFLEDIRREILGTVTKVIHQLKDVLKNGKGIPIEEYDWRETARKEEKIENDYRQRIPLTKEELTKLQQFHSPSRIPAGYTDEEIRLCIYLQEEREKQVQRFGGWYPLTLHESLFENIDVNISRTEALKKAIFEMLVYNANYQPPASMT